MNSKYLFHFHSCEICKCIQTKFIIYSWKLNDLHLNNNDKTTIWVEVGLITGRFFAGFFVFEHFIQR
jgi:hypothetical protein